MNDMTRQHSVVWLIVYFLEGEESNQLNDQKDPQNRLTEDWKLKQPIVDEWIPIGTIPGRVVVNSINQDEIFDQLPDDGQVEEYK